MISLEYLTFLLNKEPALVKHGDLAYYQIDNRITYPNSTLPHLEIIKRIKGQEGMFFSASEAAGTYMLNDSQEDVYYYHRNDILNSQNCFDKRILQEFSNIKFLCLGEAKATEQLEYYEAPNIIKVLNNKKYLTRNYLLIKGDEELGIITLLPLKEKIEITAFKSLKNSNIEQILEWLIVQNLEVEYIGVRGRRLPFIESGVIPFHFGKVATDEYQEFVIKAKNDPHLSEILNLSCFNEINLQDNYLITNNYHYFLPHSKLSNNKISNYEMMASRGYSYLQYNYQDVEKEDFFDFVTYREFIRALPEVNEFSEENYLAELGKVNQYGGKFLVIRDNYGKTISGAALEIIGKRYIYISYVFTIESARGKGYFNKIVDQLLNYANIQKKHLALSVINQIAKSVYLKKGFKSIGHLLNNEFVEKNNQ